MRALRSGKACRSLTAFAIGPRSRDHAALDKLFNKPKKERGIHSRLAVGSVLAKHGRLLVSEIVIACSLERF
jgi:hypothetical protein